MEVPWLTIIDRALGRARRSGSCLTKVGGREGTGTGEKKWLLSYEGRGKGGRVGGMGGEDERNGLGNTSAAVVVRR